ncbi:TIGR02147 family protein [Bdellovibrio sp. HCB290]|uniref:TIGR02147 family protein n=1 Tax=Bdellovibrio sp. HCB290 TaxID=3394356 RepID=UPI0039B47DAD
MKSKFATSRDILKYDFEKRRKKNSRYSQRAYAQLLGVSSGRLTEILNGKSPLTTKKAHILVRKLDLDQIEMQYFLRLVESENTIRKDDRRKKQILTSHCIAENEMALISDWEYFSLMSLIETKSFKSDKKWISKKLGISMKRLEEVLQLLIELKFVIYENGIFRNVHRSMSTTTDIPSEILRKANADCILQALEKMNTIDVLSRDVTSMTLPVDLKKIPEAKALIREFKKKMVKLMKNTDTTDIYNFNVQLVPVSQLGV